MDTFEMLKRLLSQNEFELLLPDQTGAKEKNTDKTDIRLVYQKIMKGLLRPLFIAMGMITHLLSDRKRRIVLSLSFLKRWSWKQICIIMVILRIFGEKVMKICGNWNFVLRYYGINMSILVRLSAMRKNENSCS